MKGIIFLSPLIVLLLGCGSSHENPAGHWEGNIILPGVQLAIRVDLENRPTDGWHGTIDIPAQGLRNFQLTGTSVQGEAVSFEMPGIPGQPKFAGKMAARGKEISGNFTQAGQTFPFKLERKPRTATMVGQETPTNGVPGKGLTGYWQGSLKLPPGIELRLVLEITNSPEDALGGTLVSVDQGSVRVPMSNVMLETNVVMFETPSIQGTFDGELSADGADIKGDWQQLGRTTPMTFFRLSKAPPSGAR